MAPVVHGEENDRPKGRMRISGGRRRRTAVEDRVGDMRFAEMAISPAHVPRPWPCMAMDPGVVTMRLSLCPWLE